MRRITPHLLAALLIAALPALAVEEGAPAPSFSAPRLDGPGMVSLDAFRGKVVLVDFWASWCAPCLVALPLYEELRRELPANAFQIVAVNLDRDTEKARRFLRERGVGFPSATDPEGRIPERFGLETMPTSYLLDRSGRVRHVHEGFRRGDMEGLRRRVQALVAEGAR